MKYILKIQICNKLNVGVFITIIILSACNSNSQNIFRSTSTLKLKTEIDSVSYSLGTFNAIQLQKQGLENINSEALGLGIKHVFDKNSQSGNKDSLLITEAKSI